MTTEERFERIEHETVTLAEERRKDREEYKQLWRDTDRRLKELAEESRAADRRLEARIDQLADRLDARIDRFVEESRGADKLLTERIASLVPAFGDFLSKINDAAPRRV